MTDLVPFSPSTPSIYRGLDSIIDMALATVAESSARIYQDTFNRWRKWALLNEVDELNINPFTALSFLRDQDVTLTTRQRQLSALRKLTQVVAILDHRNDDARRVYEGMKLIKAPKQGAGGKERKRRALAPEQVEKLLDVWLTDDLISIRNQALIATMFASGARRAEIVALQWHDIDLPHGTLHIRHGKGDKERHAALFGDLAVRALKYWHAQTEGREYVFCPLINQSFGEDKPITADTLYHIVDLTGKRAGVNWKPHDARRTLATELLERDMPLSEVQQQLGHAQANTTMIYAQAGSAASRRKLVDIRYGQ